MAKNPGNGKSNGRNPYAVEVGKRLARARAAAGYSQSRLAGRLGVSPSKLSNWENGIAMLPGEFVAKIFLITRINSDWLFLNDPDRLPSDIERKLTAAEQQNHLPDDEQTSHRKR